MGGKSPLYGVDTPIQPLESEPSCLRALFGAVPH